MAFLSSLDISGSALTASRLRMDVISENLANASTTRTDAGGPYRRKMVVYRSADGAEDGFGSILNNELDASSQVPGGVKVEGIVEDQTPFNTVYDPSNPDADEQGYVQMPNVDVTKETLDMMSVTRAYSANINALNAVKSMASKALEIWK
ncbi:flagellar basal body rod protein FlgC [Caproiciproducens sp. NJN-50]|uniref:flagellar basal body rod protein FlgC n=1 Tax=Acutalibacteraceae TaxID=3082771 RepID=UPI000FFE22F6|nr:MULTISPECIES: flagellar basal body rod protein FlgC [Acutalibacteraceae]QAT50695.1 flagellar basal body rod protein FlgC [Caproiciproducens sp. NJN-50]